MVVGNGLVATKFSSYNNDENFVVFTSGVSNSKNTEQEAYQREIDLKRSTIQQDVGKTLVYFSIPIAKGSEFPIDKSLVLPIIGRLKINFGETYLSRLLKKYYSQQ